MSDTDGAPLRLGISTCLLGEKVRFDGGHKRDRFLTDLLGNFVEWVPVCPEVEAGMGIPREAIRLVRAEDGIHLRGVKSHDDHTQTMERFSRRRVAALEKLDLSGYVLKRDSPSCGLHRVRVYAEEGGMPEKKGRGLFAQALTDRLPLLPVEEEGRLNDPRLRENFVERIFAYRRLRSFFQKRWKGRDLVAFHTAHKLQLLAHSPSHHRRLGRIVGEWKQYDRSELRTLYESEFMDALSRPATVARHVNVLQHMLGHFRGRLDVAAHRELEGVIEDYRAGLVPLIVPITLVRHHVRALDVGYLEGQLYLEPNPRELMLRNHV